MSILFSGQLHLEADLPTADNRISNVISSSRNSVTLCQLESLFEERSDWKYCKSIEGACALKSEGCTLRSAQNVCLSHTRRSTVAYC